MPVVIGFILVPIVVLIIGKINLIRTKKIEKMMLSILLIVLPIIYIIFCLVINMEPFSFEDKYSKEYMLYRRIFNK